jgi:hypothetical protein
VTQGRASLQRIAMTFFDRSKWDGQEVVGPPPIPRGKE